MSTILTPDFWRGLSSSTISTIRAFPMESAIGFTMAIAIGLSVDSSAEVERVALRTGLGLILGLCASLASTIVYRSGRIPLIAALVTTIIANTVSIWYAQCLNFDGESGIVEYAYVFTAMHMLVVIAWMSSEGPGRFWNATTAMFGRILIAVVFTGLLMSGLTLAVAAVRVLFGWLGWTTLEVYISTFAYCFFMTLFFLNGIPSREKLSGEPEIPRITLAFVKYVLAPLIAIFIIILYGYGIKLLSTQISEDMTLYGVILAGVSILASLLTWPLRDDPSPLWKFIHRWLYPALLPLLLMGLWSLWHRIQLEGVPRWAFTLSVLESVALLTILASIFLRSRDPRIPAVAMFSVFALTAVGPLGVNAVVERSAQNHPHVVGTQSDSTSDDGFPKEPSRQLHIATYSTVDRWMTTFSCSDYSVTSRQASVTIEPTGVLIVVHHKYKDTLRFNLPSTLRKLSPTDSIIPPITTHSFDGKRRGTLVISSISTDLTSRDTRSPGKRTLSFIQGAVYCEPTTAPHF